MNKTGLIIISIALLFALGIIFSGDLFRTNGTVQNVEIKNGVQYVSIDARGGYFPAISNAKAGIPTKLIINTNGTYDCSVALVIRQIGYQKILPETGKTEIDIGISQKEESLEGVCSMGMYNFVVEFN